MKPRRTALLLAAAAGVPAGCAQEPPPSSTAGALTAKEDATGVIRLDRRTLVFRPSRDDFTVASAVFSIHCSDPEEVRINGARPGSSWQYLDLARVGKNEFELAPVEIEFPRESRGLICMSVKVWFHEVPNEFDSLYYQRTDDRYALVSHCTAAGGPGWKEASPRFRQNRVKTLEEFKEALSRPFEIGLNQRPLSDLERLRSIGPASR